MLYFQNSYYSTDEIKMLDDCFCTKQITCLFNMEICIHDSTEPYNLRLHQCWRKDIRRIKSYIQLSANHVFVCHINLYNTMYMYILFQRNIM